MKLGFLESKLSIPSKRAKLVERPQLQAQLNAGLELKLSLVCASAGFGKTTLLSDWLSNAGRPVAWLSLDKADNDLSRFLSYMVAALQKLEDAFGVTLLAMLQAPQLPSVEVLMTSFVKDLSCFNEPIVLVLDDFHCIDLPVIHFCIEFLIEHKPDVLHLVISTREDPALPLARWRVRNQMSELRVADLRFSLDETASFLMQGMNLNLSKEDILLLERRTEGWVAGLQLAALSMQGYKDSPSDFIKSFTGSHRFVLDYLLEEVMNQQSPNIQAFLLNTSMLERLSGSLCDAIMPDLEVSGQWMLEYLERVNLFVIPLDNERKWYRYHHLFSDLLKQRLEQMHANNRLAITALHQKASQWYEDHDFELDAFHHAAKANDIKRAIRLIEGQGLPLHFRGAVVEIRTWLSTLDRSVLNDHPILWTTFASVSLVAEKTRETEEMLLAAEAALEGAELNDESKDQRGRIAAIRATIAVSKRQIDVIIRESERALALLHPDNLAFRLSTAWKLGFAYQHQGKREQAKAAYTEVIHRGQASGELIFSKLALVGLANIQEENLELKLAEQTYKRVLELCEGLANSIASTEAKLGLARIYYEWNELAKAEDLLNSLAYQAKTTDSFIDSFIDYALIQARFHLSQDKKGEALQVLIQAEQFVKDNKLQHCFKDVCEAKVLVYLAQNNVKAATELSKEQEIQRSQARVLLAKAELPEALLLLEDLLEEALLNDCKNHVLDLLILEAVGSYKQGHEERALEKLADAFNLASANDFSRSFLDEGVEMQRLLQAAIIQGLMPDYAHNLLSEFSNDLAFNTTPSILSEPLSERELEVLKLIAEGLSNREIAQRLFRAVDTIKGHNRVLFGKLQVQNRTEAVAKARTMGLI